MRRVALAAVPSALNRPFGQQVASVSDQPTSDIDIAKVCVAAKAVAIVV